MMTDRTLGFTGSFYTKRWLCVSCPTEGKGKSFLKQLLTSLCYIHCNFAFLTAIFSSFLSTTLLLSSLFSDSHSLSTNWLEWEYFCPNEWYTTRSQSSTETFPIRARELKCWQEWSVMLQQLCSVVCPLGQNTPATARTNWIRSSGGAASAIPS